MMIIELIFDGCPFSITRDHSYKYIGAFWTCLKQKVNLIVKRDSAKSYDFNILHFMICRSNLEVKTDSLISYELLIFHHELYIF